MDTATQSSRQIRYIRFGIYVKNKFSPTNTTIIKKTTQTETIKISLALSVAPTESIFISQRPPYVGLYSANIYLFKVNS